MNQWLAAGLGLVVGSVANAVVSRLPRRISWIKGRSVCDKCKHELGIWDLIPVVSYIVLGGKCRYCHSPIPLRNLMVELIMAVGFGMLFPNYVLMAILGVTVVMAAIDFETQLVPDTLVMAWGVLVVISNQLSVNSVYGLLIGVGLIGGIWLLTKKRGMGEGDIGIAAVMGWWLGWPKIAVGVWTAFVVGGVYGAALLLAKKGSMKSKIAFGPWLVVGAWVGYLWGDKIVRYVFHI